MGSWSGLIEELVNCSAGGRLIQVYEWEILICNTVDQVFRSKAEVWFPKKTIHIDVAIRNVRCIPNNKDLQTDSR